MAEPTRAGTVARLVLAAGLAAVAAPAPAASAGSSRPAAVPAAAGSAAVHSRPTRSYQNPVSRGLADTFADPSVIRAGDGWWYAYATSDPLRSGERTPHLIPTARSRDLVSWSYAGDAFSAANRPAWAAPDASFWAPDIRRVGGRYLLYYVVTQTRVTDQPNDNAIGVATAPTPTGPWTDSGAPLVGPRHGPGGPGDFTWTFDPALLSTPDGHNYLYYGSYYGGIFAVPVSADGTRVTGEPTMVAVDNRYEGAYVVRHGGWYYLFASSGDCCAGPTTGYSVFAGRSRGPLGPFTDRNGVPLTASRTGGTLVISPNGNRWVGTGHMAIATDLAGQDWLVYHAIDRAQPYLDEPFGINRRPMLIDRLDWIAGWPTVRAGAWASDRPQPAPATERPGRARGATAPVPPPRVGRVDPSYSDEFGGATLGPQWSWVRPPAPGDPAGPRLAGGELVWPTQDADLFKDQNSASVLLRDAPPGDYTAETRLTIDLGTGTVRNYQQAGLVAYLDDDDYARLDHVAIWNTRQTEFAKEMPYGGGIAFGSMTVAPPAEVTWLRLSHRVDPVTGEHRFRAAVSTDGWHWTWGGVWTLPAGSPPRIGLLSLGGAGATARFGDFRVHRP
jgi:arabinan endo-1,5-alpha-L-arabinosidase